MSMESFFGTEIFSYTTEDAIADLLGPRAVCSIFRCQERRQEDERRAYSSSTSLTRRLQS